MATSKFISERELEEQRKARQAEWEKVRQPGQPEEAPEVEDTRSLYERLKEQRDLKQLEFDETHKLKNMMKGLDSEEVEFLDLVDRMKSDEERRIIDEERRLMEEMKNSVVPAEPLEVHANVLLEPSTSTETRSKVAGAGKSKRLSKQAEILAVAIKKRKSETETGDSSANTRASNAAGANSGSGVKETARMVAVRPSASKVAGILPGISNFCNTSDESSNSSNSEESDLESSFLYTNPVQLQMDSQKLAASKSSKSCS